MFVRRRPLLRAAVVGGGAYVAGRRTAQRSAQEAEQEERISQLEQERQQQERQQAQGVPGGGEAARAPGGLSVAGQLKQLSALHEQGALSDEEFAAAKSRLLGI